MLIETVDLGLSHVGLDRLTEPALMCIFGTLELRALLQGTGNKLDDIVTKSGQTLYPAVYWTRLRVPPSQPIDKFRLLDRVGVGVNLRSVGRMILSYDAVLGQAGEVPPTPDTWLNGERASMEAGQIFVVAESEESGVPKDGCVAALTPLPSMPASIDRFREVRHQGSIDPAFDGRLGRREPVEYDLMLSRDFAPGRAVMFAWVVGILNLVEQQYLARRVFPRFPAPLLRYLTLLERETFFMSNVRRESVIVGDVRAVLEPCPEDFHGADKTVVSRAILTTCTELYEKDTGNLVVTSKVSKLLAVPRANPMAVTDATRICSIYTRK